MRTTCSDSLKNGLRIAPARPERQKISDDAVRELWSRGYSDIRIARELGVCNSAAWERRVLLGLHPNSPGGRKHVTPKEAMQTIRDCANNFYNIIKKDPERRKHYADKHTAWEHSEQGRKKGRESKKRHRDRYHDRELQKERDYKKKTYIYKSLYLAGITCPKCGLHGSLYKQWYHNIKLNKDVASTFYVLHYHQENLVKTIKKCILGKEISDNVISEVSNLLKIAIVGADGQNKAWTPLREDRAKQAIQSILYRYTIPNSISVMESIKYCDPSSIVLVSGHSLKSGVDIWAEVIADEFEIKKEIYPAEVNQWNDAYVCEKCGLSYFKNVGRCNGSYENGVCRGKLYRRKGYRSRNIQVAEAGDVIWDIEPKGSCRHCSGKGFTALGVCNYCRGTGNYSGGTWTMRYAEKLGKDVHQVVIE